MMMLKKILDFYINSSIHVALSCFALVQLTQFMFGICYDNSVSIFAFFGVIVAYNFVKYHSILVNSKSSLSKELIGITVITVLSFFVALFYFLQLQLVTKIIVFIFLFFTFLYALPFFPNKKNARNWVGVKIYIVALCWVGITLVLPIVEFNLSFTIDFWLLCVKRLLLIFVLILIFEIIDLKTDDLYLKTVPQKIGVKRTKILGLILLLLFYVLDYLFTNFIQNHKIIDTILAVTVGLFLLFCHENRSKYYSRLLVESIPILWWILVIFME